MEVQRDDVRRLGLHLHHALLVQECLPEAAHHPVVERGVLLRQIVPAQCPAGLHEQPGGVGIVGGAGQIVGGRAPVAALLRVQGHPVAELQLVVPDIVDGVVAHEVDPPAHAVELILQDALVAVGLVQRPGVDHRHVRPGGGGVRALAQQPVRHAPVLQGVGHHMGYAALGGLLQRHVPQPLAEEGIRVAQEGGRPAENLRVPRPAHALVPLGAVRGDVQEVVLQAPLYVVLQLVHQRVRAGEGAGSAHAGMHHAGGEVFRPHLPGPCLQLGVAEALEGEQLTILRAPAPADVAYLCLGRAQVGKVGVALGVQGLEAPQMHQIARLAGHAEAHPARQVLPEVQHRVALGGHDDLLHRQLLRHAHAAAGLRGQH